jgi:hypothetical protein
MYFRRLDRFLSTVQLSLEILHVLAKLQVYSMGNDIDAMATNVSGDNIDVVSTYVVVEKLARY